MSTRQGADLNGVLIKWCRCRSSRRPRVDAVMADKFEPAMKAFGLDFPKISEAFGDVGRHALGGYAFEELLTRRFEPRKPRRSLLATPRAGGCGGANT